MGNKYLACFAVMVNKVEFFADDDILEDISDHLASNAHHLNIQQVLTLGTVLCMHVHELNTKRITC